MTVAATRGRYLEIGPGDRPLPGFESLNIAKDDFSAHIANAANTLPFEDDSFDLIYASHILEHVPWTHTVQALCEWRRVLKSGAAIEVWVPDGLKICRQFVLSEDSGDPFSAPDNWYKYNDDKDACVWANGRIFTYGDGNGTLGHRNWHLALFSPRYLEKVLRQAGFRDIQRMSINQVRGHNHGWINLGMTGVK
jgi:predicted SAM-dependent methyltransferase